ncbi:hypothetical protein CEUSTIGMA_g2037.t1 [Chlamydomonas eustigma]|uniref:Cyclic nucleotide-binding domain-containing protein n=1 Tax=Chlamydomonas eustigma TaxID=1157962 RepID=A0A250WV54_9CHLO|nr:hypothetical protein CEUSTIGMA_g2037.t1 [Chlamydomonas eustigma]|eukprot:GAX74589.1 hypothetical protein CEUSTIGMA_g2037.t1 [Chlamydomonas eustigma]
MVDDSLEWRRGIDMLLTTLVEEQKKQNARLDNMMAVLNHVAKRAPFFQDNMKNDQIQDFRNLSQIKASSPELALAEVESEAPLSKKTVLINGSASPASHSLAVNGSLGGYPESIAETKNGNTSISGSCFSSTGPVAVPENSHNVVTFNHVSPESQLPDISPKNLASYGLPITMRKAGGFESLIQTIALRRLQHPHPPTSHAAEHTQPNSPSVPELKTHSAHQHVDGIQKLSKWKSAAFQISSLHGHSEEVQAKLDPSRVKGIDVAAIEKQGSDASSSFNSTGPKINQVAPVMLKQVEQDFYEEHQGPVRKDNSQNSYVEMDNALSSFSRQKLAHDIKEHGRLHIGVPLHRWDFMFEGEIFRPKRFLTDLLWTVVDPANRWRIRWDVVLIIAMVYVVVLSPYYIAFDVDTSNLKNAPGAVDLFVNCIFMLDILLNFRTAYPNADGDLVHNHRKIAIHYMAGWFWLDLVSSLPWDNILNSPQFALLKVLRLLRLLRILRFLTLMRLLRTLGKTNIRNLQQVLEDFLGRTTLRMINLMVLAASLMHWSGCAFYYSASWQNFQEGTWVWNAGLVPNNISCSGQIAGSDTSDGTKYLYSLYWAVVTMATIGYGDIVPLGIYEKVVAMVVILAGATMFAFLMGTISNIVATSDGPAARMIRKRAVVDDFLKQRNVPQGLSMKIRDYYAYTIGRIVHQDEADIISGLSMSLKMQVVLHLYREALEKVPIFKGKPPQFITSLVTYLRIEYYAPGEIVVRQGEVGTEMYFVGEGALEASTMRPVGIESQHLPRQQPHGASGVFLHKDDLMHVPYRYVGSVYSGDSFGTYSCLLGEPRGATVIATSYCELYSLRRSDLEEVVADWPELSDEFQSLANIVHSLEDAAWNVRKEMGLRSDTCRGLGTAEGPKIVETSPGSRCATGSDGRLKRPELSTRPSGASLHTTSTAIHAGAAMNRNSGFVAASMKKQVGWVPTDAEEQGPGGTAVRTFISNVKLTPQDEEKPGNSAAVGFMRR